MRRTERTGRTSRALIEAGRREERGAGVENGAIDGGGCVRDDRATQSGDQYNCHIGHG